MMSAFADNLKRIREAQGLSKTALARALGLSLTAYILYEKGEREPSLTNVKKLADALGVSVNELFEGMSGSKVQFTSAREMWQAADFEVLERVNGYVTIVPSERYGDNLFPLELPKTDFIALTNEMRKYLGVTKDERNEFAVSAYVVTNRLAAIRRKNPYDLIGVPVPIDYLPGL